MKISRINHNDLFAIVIKLRQYIQDNKINNEINNGINYQDIIDLIDSMIENKTSQTNFSTHTFNTFTDISLIYYANKINNTNIFKNYIFITMTTNIIHILHLVLVR